MNILKKTVVSFCLLGVFFSAYPSGNQEESAKNIALFIPGVLSGNPIYQMLEQGVQKAITEYNAENNTSTAKFAILEAGTNQAEWGKKLTSLVAQQKYSLIISSNPAMPDFARPILKQFPSQNFLFLDAYEKNNKNIATIRYNQREQAFLSGYASALATTSKELKYANSSKKIALIAGQEYPVMNNIILPAFIEGAKAVDKDIQVEFRIVGNWYDATKGSEIAKSLYDSGVDVILPIAGGASQGVIAAAQKHGFYISWFDDNGFNKAPGYVISSSVMAQEKMAYEQTKKFLDGNTAFGTAKTVGIRDGYIQFILDDPLYLETVPYTMQEHMQQIYNDILSGKITLNPPTF
ncbi:MAG TPA: BMP family ABC transporter substrate-binding protein [Treponemataceae bacterium]|nr:BMP family ABC transporter substrate-binding protein [Treponemataceae bacterium]